MDAIICKTLTSSIKLVSASCFIFFSRDAILKCKSQNWHHARPHADFGDLLNIVASISLNSIEPQGERLLQGMVHSPYQLFLKENFFVSLSEGD